MPSYNDQSDFIRISKYIYLTIPDDIISEEVQENTNNNLNLNVTCSISGSGTLTHTLIQHNSDPLPNWVSIDSDGMLTVNSPEVEADTTYTFDVETAITGETNKYIITVELLVFKRDEIIKNNFQKDVGTGTAISQASIGVVAIATVGSSVFGLSSLQSLWSIVNIIQLTMLLPLTMAFIPDSVAQYLIGMSFVNFNFDFIPLRDIPVVVDLDFEINKGYISDIGLNSVSTFVNHI